MTVFWKSDPNKHRRLYFSVYYLVFVSIEKIYQTLESLFIGYPNNSNFVKNTPLRVVFSTLFSVFGYPDETLSLVFDILLKQNINDITIKLKEDHKISLEKKLKLTLLIEYRRKVTGPRGQKTWRNMLSNELTTLQLQLTYRKRFLFLGSRPLGRRNRWLEMVGVERRPRQQ